MSLQTPSFHGSDLEKIAAHFPIKKEDIISFSGNVNPLGIATSLKEYLSSQISVIGNYPDREYHALRQAIAQYCDTDSDYILVGNGSTELISLTIRCINPQNCLLISPTYSEYEHEILLSGGQCHYFPILEEDAFELQLEQLLSQLTDNVDLLALCNPNNPTSTLQSIPVLRSILSHCLERNIPVMIDETYIEFTCNPKESSAVCLTKDYPNLIVLRGISKFFAAPGLRLGYAITSNQELRNNLLAIQNPWSVSSLAEAAGQVMFQDQEYQIRTRLLIEQERARIMAVLDKMTPFTYTTPTANFLLINTGKLLTATEVFHLCLQKGLLIRDCTSFMHLSPYYFRFCIELPHHNDCLLKCLQEIIDTHSK